MGVFESPAVCAIFSSTTFQPKAGFQVFGPYQILSKMGAVAYKLKLPASSMVHPVFHVSQLKKLVGQHHEVTADIPDHTFQWSVPETIIQRRCITKGTNKIQQVLIKWSNMLVSLATWEDMEALHQQFPEAAVWGQSASQERGGVSSRPPPADGPRKSSRPTKPNQRVFGPEWSS